MSQLTTARVRRPRLSTRDVVLALLPLCVATVLCVWWTRGDRLLLSGDEPHYLIMARSLWRDGDFNLRNNYEEDAITAEVFGPVEPHALRQTEHWPPYHSPGLAVLLAAPFRYAGIDGVRLALIVVASAIGIAILAWLGRFVSLPYALGISVALSLSVPLAYGSMRVYPDLPAAAILITAAITCVTWWREGGTPSMLSWTALWAAVGAMPWLQSRFIAPWLLLVAAGCALTTRAPIDRRWRLALGLLPAAALVAALLVFNFAVYGQISGPPRWRELTTSPSRALMILLGLHFDQAQGLFVQQPLWLLGLAALVPYARAYPREAIWLGLLYMSTIGPAALQMGRFGGEGAVGRYGWPAAVLWAVPMACLFENSGDRVVRRWCRGAIIVTVVWQVLLAMRWMPSPEVLVVNLNQRIWARESLVPVQLRYTMPSFYFWDFTSYWAYVPNVVVLTAAALLIATGAVGFDLGRHRLLRHAWIAAMVIAGMLLPASSARDGSAEEDARLRALTVAMESKTVRRFEAERLPPRTYGWPTVSDAQASNGETRASVDPNGRGGREAVVFGPYISLVEGAYSATIAIRSTDPAAHESGELADIRVTADGGREILARRTVVVSEARSNAFSAVRLAFSLTRQTDDIEVTVTRSGAGDFVLDYVDIGPILP